MPTLNHIVEFQAYGVAEDAFEVSAMKGEDAVSSLYRFELDLFTTTPDLSFDDLMSNAVRIGLRQTVATSDGSRASKLYNIYGMLASFEQLEKQSDSIHCRAVVVPRLWKLNQTFLSRIFQEKDIITILDDILKDAASYGMKEKDDYALDQITRSDYKSKEYVVQYQESDLDFISRWLEHDGVSYRFEMNDERERLVLMDKVDSYAEIGVKLKYRPGGEKVSKGDADSSDVPDEEVILAFVGRQKPGPAKVELTDWNYRTPDVDLKAEATVVDGGKGTVYEHGNHYKTQDEGKALAEIRAQAIKCGLKEFDGISNCRSIRAGALFEIEEHYRADFNGKYLVLSVSHDVTQPAGLQGAGKSQPKYENRFTCIPAEVLYRPARKTPWPRISGVTTALVDGDSAEKYGPIDENGQYRLRMDFDLSEQTNGKSSRPVRMSQPQAGAGYGVHYPQHLKTEVLVVHKDGNPDRPVIMGAVPNPKTPTPVKGDNKSQMILKSMGENMVLLDDKEGEEMVFINGKLAMDLRCAGNLREYVGKEHHLVVAEKQFINVKGDRNEKVEGAVKVDLGGDASLNAGGNVNVQVSGDLSLKVKGKTAEDLGSEHSEKAGKYYLKADDIVIEADCISIKSGGNSIVVDSSGVSITGTTVTIAGSTGTKINSGSGASPKSGSAGSLKAPEVPDAPKEAGKTDGPSAAEAAASTAAASSGIVKPGSAPGPAAAASEEKAAEEASNTPGSWVEVELKDSDGHPMPGERYVVKLPDDTTQAGYLGDDGKARIEGIPKGQVKVSFPDVDGGEWKDA
jgi:type VI secretion system secreted protein VgrG